MKGDVGAMPPEVKEYFPAVAAVLDTLTDPKDREVLLLRLAARLNNGDEHFDHGEPGYSWLCLKCAAMGRGGLNGWVGALQMLSQAPGTRATDGGQADG